MNPFLIEIGNFKIRYYSVFILIAFVSGYFLVSKEAKRFKVPKDYIFNIFFWVIIAGLIGARLYYVLFNFDLYRGNLLEILEVWNGGLAIHGGIIGGMIAIYFYTKKYKVRTIRFFDFIAPYLLLGQSIGRWGNFFNGEAHGVATTINHLESLHIPDFIIKGMYIDGIYYTPTFLYESLWCLLGFCILIAIRKSERLHVGELTGCYMIFYSVGRFFIEASRTDSLMLVGLKVAQIISIVLFIVGIIIIIVARRKGKFTDLYNDVHNIEKIKMK